jgi:cytochrome c oxidase subunit 2
MTTLIILLILLILVVITIQISKVTELSSKIRGEEASRMQANNRTALWLVIFMVAFLVLSVGSAIYYKNYMLGYGPLKAASEHGAAIDGVFNLTLVFTGIVFIATQILLFWYAYKYREQKGQKAFFFSHDNTLEYVWTGIPALVMTVLVVKGLVVWNDVTADVPVNEDVIEIEATGWQFGWTIRYPGDDNLLGEKDYTLIQPGINDLGQNWEDAKNHDDFVADEIVLPVNKKVRVRITAKDVLHNFYLPHFRVKMDAVPGLPSYFVFTPTVTTEEFKERLYGRPEWEVPYDPTDPSIGTKAENFNYELACAELCGYGHYSMRKIVKIVSEEEYAAWLSTQNSTYMSTIRNTENDPNKGQLLGVDISTQRKDFFNEFNSALGSEDDEVSLKLKNINFDTGSANLTTNSRYELDNLVQALNDFKNVEIQIEGYTDNTGDPSANQVLSTNRANAVMNYLLNKGISGQRLASVGFGQENEAASNDTEEGRAANRRIEFKITKK